MVNAFPGNIRSSLSHAGMQNVKIGVLGSSDAAAMQAVAKGYYIYASLEPTGYTSWQAVDACARYFEKMNSKIHNAQPMAMWSITLPIIKKYNLSTAAVPDFPFGYKAAFKKLWRVK